MATTLNRSRNTTQERRVFILAGEPSGDTIGAELMRGLKTQSTLSFVGVGGQSMLAEGLNPYFDMSELMVMGFSDVLKQLPRLLAKVRTTADYIVKLQPAAVILVDYQEFSTLLAKRLRRMGFGGSIILCVAPSVWAWRPGRARKLHGIFDEILAVFPFEPEIMEQLGGPKTTYIGHPSIGRFPVQTPPSTGLLMLLPGSRGGEIRRHMKVFKSVAQELADHPDITGIVLPTLARLEKQVLGEVADWPVPVEVIVEPSTREHAYSQTVVALASSGTVTLELAMRGVPFVGTYVPDIIQAISYLIAGRPRILLPNVVAGAEIVPEALYGPGMVQRIAVALRSLIEDQSARARQLEGFSFVRQTMEQGTQSEKMQDAAERILHYLN